MTAINRAITGLGLGVAMTMGAVAVPAFAQDETIKVGVLHSLSGTMAISETTLKDTMLFLIDQQNKKCGLLGKQLEAVVVDPASNWPLFAEKARELELEASRYLSKAGDELGTLPGVEAVNFPPRKVRTSVFNDPELYHQWH